MGITTEQLKSAIIAYTDNEIISHFQDWRKWALASYMIANMGEYNKKIDAVLQMPAIRESGVIDSAGMIDEEKAFGILRTVAEKHGGIAQTFPIAGEIKFGLEDIALLEKYVKGIK